MIAPLALEKNFLLRHLRWMILLTHLLQSTPTSGRRRSEFLHNRTHLLWRISHTVKLLVILYNLPVISFTSLLLTGTHHHLILFLAVILSKRNMWRDHLRIWI
jgi:hypothetical protein